jgi:hypothetical protein
MNKYEATINLFSIPYNVDVETLPPQFQTEITLQCDMDVTFWHVLPLDFYELYLPTEKIFPVYSVTMQGEYIQYVCEQ